MFQYSAETIDKLEGTVAATASDAFHYIPRQPLGVIGCITPLEPPAPDGCAEARAGTGGRQFGGAETGGAIGAFDR